MPKYKYSFVLALILSFVMVLGTFAAPLESVISDYAGTDESGCKDGKAAEASFSYPAGLAFDKDGAILVADCYNNSIRRIKDNTVSTIAGFSDGIDEYGIPKGGYIDGELSKAMFSNPRDIAVDSKGNIFVSDTGNNVIRKISGGKVYTFAGTGKAGFKDGKIWEAQFNSPGGLAIDGGDNVYVADTLNNVIRMISPEGNVITFAGKAAEVGKYKDGYIEEALFNEPSDIAFDKNGILYVLDSGNQLVRKVEKSMVSTAYGLYSSLMEGTDYVQGGFADGTKAEARFNFPKAFCIAEDNTIFLADTWNNRIRAIKPDGSTITIAGSGDVGKNGGKPSEAMFNGPAGILYASGKLYISDSWNNCIRLMPIELGKLTAVIPKKEIKLDPVSDKAQIWLNGERVSFKNQQPYSENGKTMVPLKDICEKWGAAVKWDGAKKQIVVTKGSITKTFAYGTDPLTAKKGCTLIPIRYLADKLGLSLEWVPEYKAVVLADKIEETL